MTLAINVIMVMNPDATHAVCDSCHVPDIKVYTVMGMLVPETKISAPLNARMNTFDLVRSLLLLSTTIQSPMFPIRATVAMMTRIEASVSRSVRGGRLSVVMVVESPPGSTVVQNSVISQQSPESLLL